MRLHELADQMEVPTTRVADGAWDVAARRARRRRAVGVTATSAAAAVVLLAVVVTARPDAAPAPMDIPTGGTTTSSPTNQRILTPEMASPRVYSSATMARLEGEPIEPPPDTPALSLSPIPYAELAMSPTPDSTEVYLLGPDEAWRRLDVPLEQVSDGTYASSPFRSTALSPDATKLALPQPSGLVVVDLTDGSHDRYPIDSPDLVYANWVSDTRVVVAAEQIGQSWELDLESSEVTESVLGPSTARSPDGRTVTWGMGPDGFSTDMVWDDGTSVPTLYNNTGHPHPFPPLVGDGFVVGHHGTTQTGLGLPLVQNALVVVDQATGDPMAYLPTGTSKGDPSTVLGWHDDRIVVALPRMDSPDTDPTVVLAAWDWQRKAVEPVVTVAASSVSWGRGW